MKIIIAGAGAVGTHLAKLLSDENEGVLLEEILPQHLGGLQGELVGGGQGVLAH